jgi:hypothetical protein
LLYHDGRIVRRSTNANPAMAIRRVRGTGGVFAVGPGIWRVDLEMTRAPGEPRRRVSRRVRGTLEEAEQVLVEMRGGQVPDTRAFGMRLPAEMAEALKRRAAANRVSVAEEIRRAVVAWLEGGPG